MAGIYIHIPFCRKLCYYCDFHFTVSLKQKQQVLNAIGSELILRKNEFAKTKFNTIYFGGGTPSILSAKEINSYIKIIENNYLLKPETEITLEANPDDLTLGYLKDLKRSTSINRLSIGVQSFNNRFLELMNRRHTGDEAFQSIEKAHKCGFENITIDLIYGIPGMSLKDWEESLDIFSNLKVPHLSAYHLSIEPKTVFDHYRKKGIMNPIDEDESTKQFEYLMQFASEHGYDHYEISNFALPDYHSKHNIGYWTGEPYLGVGPSAHSFNLNQRRWNVSNNVKYWEEIEKGGEDFYSVELIDRMTAYHDYLITALRTKWGINTKMIEDKFGKNILQQLNSTSKKFIIADLLITQGGTIFLSNKGKLVADYIIREMMISD